MPNYATLATYAATAPDNPALKNKAVNHCSIVWRRAYRKGYRAEKAEWRASQQAGDAFCTSMPPLTSRQNCQDFIACVAYGIGIKAIDEKDSGKLLYAAQVALSSYPSEKDTSKSTASGTKQPENAANRSETGADSQEKA